MSEGGVRFTAAEGGARLAATARARNTIAAELAAFVSTRLVLEEAHAVRGALCAGKQRSVVVCLPALVACAAYELRMLTDLRVAEGGAAPHEDEVLVCTSADLRRLLEGGRLTMPQINVLVIDSCHLIHTDEDLQLVMQLYKQSPTQPRILALTYPLFTSKRLELEDGSEPAAEGPGLDAGDGSKPSKPPSPVFGASPNVDDFDMYSKLEWRIEELETSLCCQMDLAEDIDGGKRFSATTSKPKELIVEYSPRRQVCQDYEDLEAFMRTTVADVLDFLEEHRYDPTEIYGEDLYEEFMNIPNPTIDPKLLFKQFLYILDELGPYGADKAAFSLLTRLEKLKIKVPYERHFLLLCVCTTVFVKIRCYADLVFSKYTDLDKIKVFSTAKVLRFIEILAQFESNDKNDNDEKAVEDGKSVAGQIESQNDKGNSDVLQDGCQDGDRKSESANVDRNDLKDKINGADELVKRETKLNATNKMLNELEKCDFIALSNKIEDKVNTLEANLNDIRDMSMETVTLKDNTCENLEKVDELNTNISETDHKDTVNDLTASKLDPKTPDLDHTDPRTVLGFTRRPHRVRGRGRVQRSVIRSQQAQMNPDALCGIVFMNEPIMAKIMFLLVVELSRSSARLSGVCAQYCCAGDGPGDPAELRRRCRAREDALKKFRMHDCNLLLATPALEEGIDLPRCNLVLRWDLPPSYRSHGLCRGRARAPRSVCAVLCPAGDVTTPALLRHLAIYNELDQIISRKCGCGIQDEPPQQEEDHADSLTTLIQPYTPAVTLGEKSEEDSLHDKEMEDDSSDINEKIDDGMENRSVNADNLKETKEVDDIEKVEERRSKMVDFVKETNDEDTGNSSSNCYSENKKLDEAKEIRDEDICENSVSNSISNTSKYEDLLEKLDDVKINDVREKNSDDKENNDKCAEKACDEVNRDVISTDIKIDCSDESKSKSDYNKTHDVIETLSDFNKFEDKIIENAKETKLNEEVGNKVSEVKSNREISDSELNLVCNKCNKKRTSVQTECCVDGGDKIDTNDCSVKKEDFASVDLGSAIALINRYCGKLPSDTFTRLAPSWRTERVRVPADGPAGWADAWTCSLRLPLNCPVKYNIVGHPMPTRALARRVAALQACRVLHRCGELDDQLMPIGKENFKAAELEGAGGAADARPGTTKRRQYYYKRTARAFTDCEPIVDTTDEQIQAEADGTADKTTSTNVLYAISCTLWCALPERYNTRGRRLHAPQHAQQAVGVLMRAQPAPDRLQIPSFPVYTRSGEVRVQVSPCRAADTRLSPRRATLVTCFMRFVFAEVLRVRRRGMTLQTEGCTRNNYYVVPTLKVTNPDGSTRIDIDWRFLEQIYQYTEDKKNSEVERPMVWKREEEDDKADNPEKRKVKKMENPLLKPGETFVFDADKYREAVVTPWYRNQDQPQFFLVAEICWNLTPDSAFPSATHASFREYYSAKYGVTLTQPDQPLLDVDHTSARLNLLTPRYVNRKGVALPVSSERTRRAKRDRLDQKQILVPELCTVHPFAAPLWFATVALPCVLYRINALLIADEIRRAVAIDVGLGIPRIDDSSCPGFQWPPLDFGWSLSEVLSADSEKTEKKKENDVEVKEEDETETKIDNEGNEDIAEPKEKTINDILQEKEDAESGFEIGTWDNNMASSIPQPAEFDDLHEPLPSNLTFCTSASGGANWCDPVQKPKNQFNPSRTFSMADSDCSYMSSDFDTDDSDLNSEGSSETDTSGFCSSKSNAAMGVRIEYKTAHEAEAVDLERQKSHPAPQPDDAALAEDRRRHATLLRAGHPPDQYLQKFQKSVVEHEQEIIEKGLLIQQDQPITDLLPETNKESKRNEPISPEQIKNKFEELFPYKNEFLNIDNGPVTLESIEKNKRYLLDEFKKTLADEEIEKLTCFSMVDVDIDSPEYRNEKVSNIGFDTKESYVDKVKGVGAREFKPYYEDSKGQGKEFDFDYQPDLEGHPGPSPSVILQALTMSNANDGINLERLETIGDSFLKFAITAYLYCAHPTVHEGKLSHMRSKQVSNLNLYRLGVRKRLGARMIASKFEPHDNWLPPAHRAPPAAHAPVDSEEAYNSPDPPPANTGCFIPYNLITQHSIPDKSIADCVEALIGAYLLECGPRGALLFMAWLGIRVLPRHDLPVTDPGVIRTLDTDEKKKAASNKGSRRARHDSSSSEEGDDAPPRPVGSLAPYRDKEGQWILPMFGELKAPPSPLLRYIADPEGELEQMLSGYDALERTLQYRFKDRSLLLQALTHASHQRNRLTDCYQRLEFLGDAILDYLITRHLYEDPRRHSPGALTDLRSALVNNTIFATLAARHGFHKYFRHMSPGLNEVLTRYVKIQEENGHSISEEHYLIHEDEMEQAEDVEVPKALGDLFESVAGAIFLDSGMSLAAVWNSYVLLMGAELEAFSAAAPKSPVRELLEAEPDTAKFGKPERLADGRRVRVCVEVFGRGAFKGVGRNYRIAKGTAARCALRHLKQSKQH
ncbi:endoribonuclease Dcr-1 [Choristoneura fumiferana]|uniref:endoribonuclease Dcr-1 n=1 Tax=Choristoneura fumiferana TaxID=7141 RepID=UPI003D15B374